jgi:polar amino acid transport system substrate-binding protein
MPILFLLALGISLSGCGLPRDPAGTLEYVRGGTLRVGVAHNPPWVIDRGGDEVDGVEGRLAASIAGAVHARIEWVRRPEFELIKSLRKRELHLVIGGFDAKLPWAQEVAFTRPYMTSPEGVAHVLAAPPGENQWLMLIEQTLEWHKPSLPAVLTEVSK